MNNKYMIASCRAPVGAHIFVGAALALTSAEQTWSAAEAEAEATPTALEYAAHRLLRGVGGVVATAKKCSRQYSS